MKTMIVVHCSATKPSMDIGVKEIREWHVNGNGWSDIGYAYVIRRNGALELGRDLDRDGNVDEETGAHAKGFNVNSIGICLVGGISDCGKPDANYTIGQYIALDNLIHVIKRSNPIRRVVGHRDLDPSKDCPCFSVKEFLGNK